MAQMPDTHPNYRHPIDVQPIAFGSPNPCRLENSDIDLNNVFVVSNLLSRPECTQLIETAERQNPTKVDWEYVPDYRDCSRVILRSPELAVELYSRVIPLLTSDECERVRPFGFDGVGDWRPFKINEVVRISRYDEGGRFRPHRDGAFVENDDVRSVYTVLVYLNESPSFGGGTTNLYSSTMATASGDLVAGNVISAIQPQTGSALIMPHDTLHSGEVVTEGQKYIARFDVMFYRLGGGMGEECLSRLPKRNVSEQLYASSIAKQRAGDPGGSTEDYVQALNLQATIPSVTPERFREIPDVFQILPPDLFILCVRYLDLVDIARASTSSRSWNNACSNGLLWRELFMLRWPALTLAESTVTSNSVELAVPLEIRIDQSLEGRFSPVYVTVLRSRPEPLVSGGAMLERILYGTDDAGGQGSKMRARPHGYMFSSLPMVDFPRTTRQRFAWKNVKAMVNGGTIYFREVQHEKGNYNRDCQPCAQEKTKHGLYDDILQPVPLLSDTGIFFCFRESDTSNRYHATAIDTCILELRGTGEYLAICRDNPKQERTRYEWSTSGLTGIFEDIARVRVALQTERALRLGNDEAIRCDSKTKQWKTAYSRRHSAERLFDVVTVDIGSMRAKFASRATIDEMLVDLRTWSSRYEFGAAEPQRNATQTFFTEALRKHHPILLDKVCSKWWEDSNDVTHFFKRIAKTGVARSLVDVSLADPYLVSLIPPAIFEARHGCGSVLSLVAESRGHMWSVGHGLQNHFVGESCLSMGSVPKKPYGKDCTPDFDVICILCAYIVEHCYARRPQRAGGFRFHRTIAEHPINVVEPPQGFREEERRKIIDVLSTWNVPFVGFVNGSAAALMCGDNPKRDGIVVMVGGVNSAVTNVTDGTLNYIVPVRCCAHDNTAPNDYVISQEVIAAIRKVLGHCFSDVIRKNLAKPQVLMTGGKATDSLVSLVQAGMSHVQVTVASREYERHLDAVRGGHILANLSNSAKHFKAVLHPMWAMK